MILRKIFLLIFISLFTLHAQDSTQTFISLKNTGVQEFLERYPDYDGRGTIVLVLDTGVDMGVEGLLKTTTGEHKVIDVQDFTKQGDISFYEADTDEEDGIVYFTNEDKNYKVAGADKLAIKPVDDNYYIGLLEETLWKNSGSGASDVNGNGTTDDKFYFVTFLTEDENEQYWVVYFDQNTDGDLSDETPIRNYKKKYDAIYIPNEEGLTKFTIGINISPDEKLVTFYFDDGVHGTNCAGISAGYKIGGVDFNGIAPGAKVMGLKLGNNNYSGGATVTESMKKCYLYADKISKEREEPCIINMSFGVGSEIEGKAEIETFLDKLTKNNPYLYISTSNGNSGPGISTAGMPAATNSIFSSGAVLTQEVGSDLYGSTLEKDIILHFSSRGGETSKPDVVAPGASSSTVPNFSRGDRMWGTSMASPYSAGVMALLLSAAKAEYPDTKIPSQFLYKVIRESAVPIEGYTHVDQGGGYINVINAYELMKKYLDNKELSRFETYTVTSFAPNMPDGNARNLYIRNGSFITGNEPFNFSIKRNNLIEKNKFYRIFNLKSDQDWLVSIKNRTYIRNNQTANVSVKIDRSKMNEPGLYNGMITAYRADNTKIPEFELMATVVIPYKFNEANDYRMSWKDLQLAPGEHKRYFVEVPSGASSMKVKLTSNENTYTNCWYFLHDPDGKNISVAFINSEKDENSVERRYYDLSPGIYEIDVLGFFRAQNVSSVNLTVEFDGVNRLDKLELSEFHKSIRIINNFNEVKNYNLKGEILGYEKNYVISLDSTDHHSIPFLLRKGESSKEFTITLSKEDFNKTTDFALMILNEDGKSQSSSALSYREASIRINNRYDTDSVKLTLELLPGFTNEPGKMTVHIKETTRFKQSQEFEVKYLNRQRITLYPLIEKSLNCSFSKPDEYIPGDSKPFGSIQFESVSDSKVELELPVFFKF